MSTSTSDVAGSQGSRKPCLEIFRQRLEKNQLCCSGVMFLRGNINAIRHLMTSHLNAEQCLKVLASLKLQGCGNFILLCWQCTRAFINLTKTILRIGCWKKLTLSSDLLLFEPCKDNTKWKVSGLHRGWGWGRWMVKEHCRIPELNTNHSPLLFTYHGFMFYLHLRQSCISICICQLR